MTPPLALASQTLAPGVVTVKQRSGAGVTYLHACHPDIMTFLDTKRENADEKIRIKTLSLGVVMPDVAFHMAREGKDLYLFSPYDVYNEYGVTLAEIGVTDRYDEMVANPNIRKSKVNARELFKAIAELQFESGYPYLMMEDTANRLNTNTGRIVQSNLCCVTGDTLVLTDGGYRTAEELWETQDDFKVAVDERARTWSMDAKGVTLQDSTRMVKTIRDAEVFTLKTKEGFTLTATSYHKMYIDQNGEVIKVPLSEVKEGDRIILQGDVGAFGSFSNSSLAYISGVVAADGTFGERRNGSKTALRIDLYGDKSILAPGIEDAAAKALIGQERFLHHSSTLEPKFGEVNSVDRMSLSSAPLGNMLAELGYGAHNKMSVPKFVLEGTRQVQESFISGVMQLDGCVTGSKSAGSVSIELGSISRSFLTEMQTLLLNHGVYSRIYQGRAEDGKALFPNGKGGYAEYNQKASWTLRVTDKASRERLYRIVDWMPNHQARWDDLNEDLKGKKAYKTHDFRATVTSIEYAGREDVYDVTVENGNSLIFNGIATGNSEILQSYEASELNEDLTYSHVGMDISCNLASMNIAQAFGSRIGETVNTAVKALSSVADQTNIESVPSIARANRETRSIGLGQMNLHGFLAHNRIHYDSPEAVDFTSSYFATVTYYAIKASCELAKKHGPFTGFDQSTYADGSYFEKYVTQSWHPKTDRVQELFEHHGVNVPTMEDWTELKWDVITHGIYNSYLQAVPPTGSISYINNSTSSIHPITSKIEIRKEGRIGRVYYPAPHMTDDNLEYYKDAYEIGPEAIINVYAAATEHVDQGLSMTLFFRDTATTRDVNKAQIYAWKKGIKSIYYARVRQAALEGTEAEGCVSCML